MPEALCEGDVSLKAYAYACVSEYFVWPYIFFRLRVDRACSRFRCRMSSAFSSGVAFGRFRPRFVFRSPSEFGSPCSVCM